MNLQVPYLEIERLISKKFQKEISINYAENNMIHLSGLGIKADVRIAEIINQDIVVELKFEIGKMVVSDQTTRIIIHLRDIESLSNVLEMIILKNVSFSALGPEIEADVMG